MWWCTISWVLKIRYRIVHWKKIQMGHGFIKNFEKCKFDDGDLEHFQFEVISLKSTKMKITQILQNPLRGTFLEKFSTVGNWYFHLFKWRYLARSTGLKCWIWKINENAWCIFQKCAGGFWRRKVPSRIPRGLGLRINTKIWIPHNIKVKHNWISSYANFTNILPSL